MAGTEHEPLTGAIVDDRVEVTLEQVSLFCAVRQETISALVEEGVLHPQSRLHGEWRFGGRALHRAARAVRLQRDLEVEPSALALILDLLDEIETLRARLGAATRE